jgi:hypothetical protein
MRQALVKADMYKTASRRTGGSRYGYGGKNPTIQYGPPRYTYEIKFPCTEPCEEFPSTKQIAFSKVISTRLRVQIPFVCDQSKSCMEAFLAFYSPYMNRYNDVETAAGREELLTEIRTTEQTHYESKPMVCKQVWKIVQP